MKRRFIEEPANCKLLIVVSKLLTGFDAPSCTYIYLDNEMHDHNSLPSHLPHQPARRRRQGLRPHRRLQGDCSSDVQEAIAVYNSDELDIDEGSGGDDNVDAERLAVRKARNSSTKPARRSGICASLSRRRARWSNTCTTSAATRPTRKHSPTPSRCASPSTRQRLHTSCAPTRRLRRNLDEAGYSAAEIAVLERETQFYSDTRAAIKKHSGEELDIKPYEADMRHLINTYVQADPAADLGSLSQLSLTEMIIETGIHDAIARKLNAKGKLSNNAIAEGIINNVRKTIIRDQLTDPRFYAEMSKLLDDLIKQQPR